LAQAGGDVWIEKVVQISPRLPPSRHPVICKRATAQWTTFCASGQERGGQRQEKFERRVTKLNLHRLNKE